MDAAIPAGTIEDEEAARGPMVESWSWLVDIARRDRIDRTRVRRERRATAAR
jgi:hypothetical protein